MIRLGYVLIGAIAGICAAPQANAAGTTLTFAGPICGIAGDEGCGNGSQIGQGYGDGTGVDVGYRSAVNGSAATFEPFLKLWNTGYGDLQGVVWGGVEPAGTFNEITLAALTGYELRVTGFDAGCYQNRTTCQNFPFSISEIGGGVVASGTNTPPANSHDTQAFSLDYSRAGYVLRWGPDGYDGGLDNITFDVRQIDSTGAVPEPATWAMLVAGFGAIGGALRRRRPVVGILVA